MKQFKAATRPVLSYIAMLGLTVGFFMELIPPEAYSMAAIACITWWFKSRDEEKRSGGG